MSPNDSVRKIRKLIIWFTAALVVFIGVPWFLYTTSIHRAELPSDQIDQVNGLLNGLQVKIPVYVTKKIDQAQATLNADLYGKYPLLKDFWSIDLIPVDTEDHLDLHQDYLVKVDEAQTEDFLISPFVKTISLASANLELLSNVLINHVFPDEIEKFNRFKQSGKKLNENNLIIPYSSHYNLIFSLFIEDGNPVIWDPLLITRLFGPLLSQFSHLTNFTISTQIQYYSNTNVDIKFNETTNSYILQEKDLSNFINFGDWNLNNHDIDPSMNFIIYFPHSNHENRLLTIENSKTNSFLIPQYGGVHIMNKKVDVKSDNDEFVLLEEELIETLEIFSSQLFKLLGISNPNPKNTLMRIDSLTRLNTYQNLFESIKTLKSLINLTNSLGEISVPELTNTLTKNCLNSIVAAIEALKVYQFKQAMIHSSEGLNYSIKAFFDKEIVQQVYFPSEHKLAVFLPLLGPLCSILFFTTIRQVKEFKEARKVKAKAD